MAKPKKISRGNSKNCSKIEAINPQFSDLKTRPPHKLSFKMEPQPSETTCGPTCLQAVYRYFGDDIALSQVIEEVHAFEGGGTLAVWLGCHALQRGYEAAIYTYNMQTFDPSWFTEKDINLVEKLHQQIQVKPEPKLVLATQAYTEFLERGGQIFFEDMTRGLLRQFLNNGIPILTGLNSNFLYRSKRSIPYTNEYDDILGTPEGHFVVLRGYEKLTKSIYVADPYSKNPYASVKYEAPIDRVICAIMLGILTDDANFLIIHPK